MIDYMAWNADRSRDQLSSYLLLAKKCSPKLENGDRYEVLFPENFHSRSKYLMRLDFPSTETFLLNSHKP